MKKHYLFFGIIYCVAIFALFFGLLYYYSKNKVKDINSYYTSSFSNQFWSYQFNDTFSDTAEQSETTPDNPKLANSVNVAEYVSNLYSNQGFLYSGNDDVGVYNSILNKADNYSVIAESRDVLFFNSYKDEIYYSRIAFPTNELPEMEDYHYYNISGFEDTMLDDRFIYGGQGEMSSYSDNVELILDSPYYVNDMVAEPFAEWKKDADIRIETSIYNKSAKQKKNNLLARKLSYETVEKYKNGEVKNGYVVDETGFFKSRKVVFVEIKDFMLITFTIVYKPFLTVIKQDKKLYMIAILLFLLIEAATIFSIRALYLNQKSFEIRSQRLTRGVAHELKTPLAVTKACVENWEYIDEKDRPEYSEKIITEVDHMAGLITKLLELSRLNAGKNQLNREDIDLLKLTKKVYSEMSELAKEKKLDVSISGYDDDKDKDKEYFINADPEMMHMVISNFISNAIKYSESYIKIVISDQGKKIEFRITNDGATIERKDIPKVWDMFYKTDESRNDRIASSGVGLAVVKSILDLHKSKYGCESNVQNTTFYFIIDKAKEN